MGSTRTVDVLSILSEFAEAGLRGDRDRTQLLTLKAIRALKKDQPEASDHLAKLLASATTKASTLRGISMGPPPADQDEGLALVRVEDAADAIEPILPEGVRRCIATFLNERQDSERLLMEGFSPPCSMLLVGPPGTGKTMLAKWLANQLGLSFAVQDLAASVSSFLGKTGINLKRSLDFARSSPCLMLLDEFDAIAKRRDDSADVGELKRIVNVLLKELESWPIHSVLIAATNHAEILDPAIQRRFDVVVHMPLPGEMERKAIIQRSSGRFSEQLSDALILACSAATEGVSGSDLERLTRAAVRQHLVSGTALPHAMVCEVHRECGESLSGKCLGSLIREVKSSFGKDLTVRSLAEMFGRTPSTIHHHLKKEGENG